MIEFTEDLIIGVEKIDNQHRELIKRLNDFLETLKEGKGKEELIKIFSFLEYYTVFHFDDEEELQKEINYPYFEKHKEIHKNFKEEILKLKEGLNKDTTLSTTISLSKKLLDWYINHIKKEDKKIKGFINSN